MDRDGDSARGGAVRGARSFAAVVLMALGVIATPFFVDAFTSEVGQVAALCVAVFPLGFWAAAALTWRGPFFVVVVGAVLGFLGD